MSEHNIQVQGGTTVRLKTAGKYCDRDILVSAEGVDLPALSNEGTADDLMQGKQMISGAGAVVDGKFTLANELNAQDSLITQIREALKGKAAGGGGSTEPDYKSLYQRVEYIQSTTGCRIDTDIFADNETGMELIAKYPTLADRVPMGSRLDGNATRYYTPYPLSANSFYYGFNAGVTKSTGAVANTLYRSSLNFLNNRVSSVKEEATNAIEFADVLTSTLSQHTAPIGIFCYLRVTSGETALQSSRDIIFYGARISQGREIVREYIPCYRKSDGEIGLYEKFTGQFLTNTGSGTFDKGADIDW